MHCHSDKECPIGAAQYSARVDDTFYKISKYYSITLDDLIDANPDTDPDNINAGDTLCIPLSLQMINRPAGTEIYTIEQGDTIYKLAKKFNMKLNTLLNANNRINPDALLPGQIIYIPKPYSKYISEECKIEFLYPSRWAKVNDLNYEGVNGFFRIAALKSDKALEEICKEEAFHKLKPYGTHPEIIPTAAAGLNACLVIPSMDQPMEMKKQAAMVIKYPKELKLNGENYNHMIIWADKEHIADLISSLAIKH